jgi:fructose 1,6-bisphosphate aldolase/phosphatase
MTHGRGVGDEIHKLAWEAFVAGTATAKDQGLYGAGQDLLKDSLSGNVHGMGPAVAEMEVEERPADPFLFFAADKTDPGAYNLPLFLSFADVMTTPGLILSPKLSCGFHWVVMDVNHSEGDRVIELDNPEEIDDLAALLRDNQRFVVESVWSRATGEQCVAVLVAAQHRRQIYREG